MGVRGRDGGGGGRTVELLPLMRGCCAGYQYLGAGGDGSSLL